MYWINKYIYIKGHSINIIIILIISSSIILLSEDLSFVSQPLASLQPHARFYDHTSGFPFTYVMGVQCNNSSATVWIPCSYR